MNNLNIDDNRKFYSFLEQGTKTLTIKLTELFNKPTDGFICSLDFTNEHNTGNEVFKEICFNRTNKYNPIVKMIIDDINIGFITFENTSNFLQEYSNNIILLNDIVEVIKSSIIETLQTVFENNVGDIIFEKPRTEMMVGTHSLYKNELIALIESDKFVIFQIGISPSDYDIKELGNVDLYLTTKFAKNL